MNFRGATACDAGFAIRLFGRSLAQYPAVALFVERAVAVEGRILI